MDGAQNTELKKINIDSLCIWFYAVRLLVQPRYATGSTSFLSFIVIFLVR
jgi:hypothetical protein